MMRGARAKSQVHFRFRRLRTICAEAHPEGEPTRRPYRAIHYADRIDLSSLRCMRHGDADSGAAVMRLLLTSILVVTMALTTPARSETPEEWIKLGARTHGGFGAFIPVGIRIGLDALERLNAEPRDVIVIYYDSDKAPCACIADGVALATVATVGQRTLRIAPEKAPDGAIAVVVVQNKQSGEAVRYTVPDEWLPTLAEWNRTLDEAGRYDAVMSDQSARDRQAAASGNSRNLKTERAAKTFPKE